jgi:transposase
MNPTTVAVDLAKSVFQISIADDKGRILKRQRYTRRQFERFLKEAPTCHFVLEACGTAHHWGRLLLSLGHTVVLLSPQYVKPFVRRTKTDQRDADALIQAARSGEIPPVAVKSCDQQQMVALHRSRAARMKTRTARINLLRGLLSEQGVPIAVGARTGLAQMARLIHDDEVELPDLFRECAVGVLEEIASLERHVAAIEAQLRSLAKQDVAQELQTIPGIGLLTATALVGSVAKIDGFPSGRHFASWLGLTPREHSSGGKQRLGRITKRGDTYLRCLLTHGARSVLLSAKRQHEAGKTLPRLQAWAVEVEAKRGHNKATIAVANKLARFVWAVWSTRRACESEPAQQAA